MYTMQVMPLYLVLPSSIVVSPCLYCIIIIVNVCSYFNAEDHFEALFTKCIKSEYRKEASFISDMHQDHALMKCGDKDLERWYLEVDCSVPLHPHNPCEFDGIFFSGVEIWGKMHNYAN